jgi:hypothetical protein
MNKPLLMKRVRAWFRPQNAIPVSHEPYRKIHFAIGRLTMRFGGLYAVNDLSFEV